MTKRLRLGDKSMIEACGPVQISKGEEFYIGAPRVTNNTSEMQGVIEALFWLNSCVERRTLHADDDVLITVDSLYVKGLIDEENTARENRVLARLCHMWKVTKQNLRLHIRWRRGLSGDVGNGIADRLADAGTRQELQHLWWRRCPLSGGWDEEGFIKKVVSIQSETTVCQDALETRWTGPTDFPRTDTASHKLVPALGTLTIAIAKSAIAWRAVKREKAGLEQHDPLWMEVRKLGVERRWEKDPLKRKNCPSRCTELDS